MKYADVVIPLKFKDSVTYSIPGELEDRIVPGSIVKVTVVGRTYTAVVLRIKGNPEFDPSRIKPVREIVNFPPVTNENMEFLRLVAGYYMCSLGEAFRFAAPSTVKPLKRTRTAGDTDVTDDCDSKITLPVLSEEQETAAGKIRSFFKNGRNVLLHGVTGSGKTEIYITLAAECMEKGLNVLYLVPEIAISRQIQSRMEKHFGDRLMVYHSGQTPTRKREVYRKVADSSKPFVLLGLRSALFLPFRQLGLVIVDEEHDSSYKQSDQAPRYHGRDTALMLGMVMKCPVLLGSATPSFESIYNVRSGKLGLAVLSHRYYESKDCLVRIIDMVKEKRKNAVKGPFSLILLKAIEERLAKKEQVLIFRSRRAYASALQCSECGAVPKCPRCNIPMSYHKFNDSLSCHYCGCSIPAPHICPECGNGSLKLLGDGTERIEEALKELFPEARTERFDADTAQDMKEESRLLRQFAAGEIDIMVGTQMISKGFDFSRLTLTAVLKAEAMTQVFDFRADERALQLLTQLMGRAGRRNVPGEMIVQTNRADHPVFEMLLHPGAADGNILIDERMEFGYPPFSRIIKITVKDTDKEKAARLADEVRKKACDAGFDDICGPAPHPMETYAGEHRMQLIIKTGRSRNWSGPKQKLYACLRDIPSSNVTVDVDPVST